MGPGARQGVVLDWHTHLLGASWSQALRDREGAGQARTAGAVGAAGLGSAWSQFGLQFSSELLPR